MIALAKEFIHTIRVIIPLPEPPRARIYTGSAIEKIDAVIGPDDRIEELIIHTRGKSRTTGVRVFSC